MFSITYSVLNENLTINANIHQFLSKYEAALPNETFIRDMSNGPIYQKCNNK